MRIVGRLMGSAKIAILFLIIAAGAGGAAYYFYQQNQKTLRLLNNPDAASQEEVTSLTEKIGKLMDLPSGEKPTVITVVDKEKLKDQKFFEKAENGDKVLAYTESKKAIMYRPSTNKIVEVGPIELTPNETFKVTLFDGTGNATTDGLIDSTEKSLKEKVQNLEFIASGSTKAENYTKNLVIDLKGDRETEAKQIAEIIGGEVSNLPSTETKPDADFMVIVAK